MKNSFKRLLALITAAMMSLAMVSCSNDDSSSSQPASSEQQTSSQQETVSSVTDSTEDSSTQLTERDYDARVYVEGTSFMVDGKEIWFNAVNTPWDKWNDFGGSFDPVFWDEHFAKLKDAGINSSRIWINCNGLVGVYVNEDGSFDKVTDKHWSDLDKLFELADKHGIYIMATMLSFDHFKDSNNAYDNWRNMIKSSDNIDSFVEGYIIPFVERYDDNDFLYSIDLMNEADWVFENTECGKISWDNISNYFSRAAAGIHENSDVLVTAGMGIIKYNSDNYQGNKVSDEYLKSLSGNENSHLDFYSPHYYYWQKQWFGFPFDKTPQEYGLTNDRPCVIGECASLDEGNVSIGEKYQMAYDNGWNGVYVWTSNGVDACGGFIDIAPSAKKMYEQYEEMIFPFGK